MLLQVRYTSEVLAASTALLGKDLRVYYNNDDLRTVRAFLADGSELGTSRHKVPWGEISHDLKLRREIMKLRGKKRLAFTVTQEFIDRFVEEKRKTAKHSRRAASDLARMMRTLANAPTSNTPPGPPEVGPAAPVAAPPSATDPAPGAQAPQKSSQNSSRFLPASRQSSKWLFRSRRSLMSLKTPRPIAPDLHPIATGNYRIATPAIQEIHELVMRCLRYRTTGALIHGASRTGKARAIEYVRLLLAQTHPKVTT